jgi:hydroxymethylpyrimidine/phosphomethylpyrimidine kinase
MTIPVTLSVAGSDSSAGAGIQVDLRMFSALGTYGTTAITALTAQNPGEVTGVVGVEASFVKAQIDAVFAGMPVRAMKTGMLWSAEVIQVVADFLKNNPKVACVVDPVMIATSGAKLVTDEAIEVYKTSLLPRATLMTPNIDEARVLLEGKPIGQDDQAAAAQELSARYRCAVLLKGGHLVGDPVDILFENGEIYRWKHPRLENVNTHGSGCMLAAAITAHLAHGKTLREAVEKGLDAVHQVLAYPVEPAPGLALAGIESLRS